jgi:hypothetical protein
MKYGLNERTSKAEFSCEMCKKYYIGQFSYEWGTFEVLPKTPMKILTICEKCIIRESKFKNKKQLKEHYEPSL